MKMNKIYAWMAAAMTLAACSTNDIADLGGNDTDNVVNVAATRANTSSNSNAIKAFHLVNTTQQSEYDKKYEADYKYDDASSTYVMTNGTVLWCNTDDNEGNKVENVFKAFTPLSTAANLASYDRFYIPIYQASPELLAAADWMTATATSTKAEATDGLSLNFTHRHAKLHFTVTTKGDDVTTLSSEDITVIGGITPYYHTDDDNNKTIEAIVAPVSADEITSSTSRPTLISFRLAGGDEISVPLPTSISQIEAGKQYNFSITLGHYALTISSVSVTDWMQASVATGKENEAWNGSNALKLSFSGNLSGAKLVLTYHYTEPQTSNNAKTRTPDASISQKILSNCIKISSPNNAEGIEVVIRSEKNSSIAEIPLNNDANIVLLSAKGGINTNGTTNFTFPDNETLVPGYLTIGVTGDSENVKDIKLDVSGDLRSLVNASDPKNADTSKAKFTNLFKDCTQLKSFEKIQLNGMAENCCEGMFENSGLEQSPILPDQTSQNCYINMFKNCIDLKQVELPAKGLLSPGCYNGVLSGCVNLEYLKLGVTSENLNSFDYDVNSPFWNFIGQSDDKQEITDDDGTTNFIDNTAGSNTTQRTLVVNKDVNTSMLGLPTLWTDTTLGANIIFAD